MLCVWYTRSHASGGWMHTLSAFFSLLTLLLRESFMEPQDCHLGYISNFPPSAYLHPEYCLQLWHYRHMWPCLTFTWVLGIWMQVLLLSQKCHVSSPPSYLFIPLSSILLVMEWTMRSFLKSNVEGTDPQNSSWKGNLRHGILEWHASKTADYFHNVSWRLKFCGRFFPIL